MTKEIQKYPDNARTENEIKIFLSDQICEQVVRIKYKNSRILCTIKDRITFNKKEVTLTSFLKKMEYQDMREKFLETYNRVNSIE